MNYFKSEFYNGKFKEQEYVYNHEAGHFLYIINNLLEYMEYYENLLKNKIDLDGGHRPDDKSGEAAKLFGSVKDIVD